MTRKSTASIFIIAAVLAASCAKQFPLPESYGVYLRQGGALSPLSPGQAVTVEPTGEFIVYNHKLVSGLFSPQEFTSVLRRRYVRKTVELICPAKDEPATRLLASDYGKFESHGNSLQLAFTPVEGKAGMLIVAPQTPFESGLYYLVFGDQKVPFRVGVTDRDETAERWTVDKYITTIDRNANFSWDNWFHMTQSGRGSILKTEYSPVGRLTQFRDQLSHKAAELMQQYNFSASIRMIESYETIEPQDTSLRQRLSAQILAVSREAKAEGDWAAVAVYAAVAQKVLPDDQAASLYREGKAHLSKIDDSKQRLTKSKEASVVLWKSRTGEQVQSLGGMNDTHEPFIITDVGISTLPLGEAPTRYKPTVGFGDISGFQKHQMKAKIDFLKYSDERPAIIVDTHGQWPWGLVFLDISRRDECLQELETAHSAWRNTNFLGHASWTVSPGKVSCEISALSRAWTPPVVFSKRLRMTRFGSGYGYYLRYAEKGTVLEGENPSIPLGEPVQFMSESHRHTSIITVEMGLP